MSICQAAQYLMAGMLILMAVGMFLLLVLTIKEALWLYRVDKNSRVHGGSITSWTEYREATKTGPNHEGKTA